MKSDTLNAVNELKDNIMFRLSLSSTELFHSNFLYCLFKDDRDGFLRSILSRDSYNIISRECNIDKLEIEREFCLGDEEPKDSEESEGKAVSATDDAEEKKKKSIVDIAIGVLERGRFVPVVIIENKVKSYPDEKQLRKEKYNFEKKYGGYRRPRINVLLSFMPIIDREGIKRNCNFESIEYHELIDNLRERYHIGPDVRHFFDDYCRMIDSMYECLRENLNVKDLVSLSEHFDLNEKYPVLEDVKLRDIYMKYRSSFIMHAIKDRLKHRDDIIYESGLANKNGLVTAFVDLTPEKKILKNKIGVQIQGEQFRICLEYPGFADIFTNDGLLFDKWDSICGDKYTEGSHKVIKEPSAINSFKYLIDKEINFCRYGNAFIYRYRKIKNNESLSSIIDEVLGIIDKI